MKKILIVILVSLTAAVHVLPSQFILREVNEPKTVSVSGDRLVISEDESILIYSLKKKKLIKAFGKNGEGPGEFKLGHGAGSLKIDIIENKIIVNSGGKLSWFTLEGEFIREVKAPPMTYLIPVKDKYIGNCTTPVEENFPSLSVCLYEKDLSEKTPMFTSGVPVGMGAKIMVPSYNFIYRVYKDNIYLSTGKDDIIITILNGRGEETGIIRLKNSSLKVDEQFKERVYDFYKNDPVYKNYWEYMKRNMYFPEHFPGLKDMIIDNKRLHIQTYKMEGDKFEWIITDLNGKILKRISLPQNIESAVAYSPIAISDGKYYYLKENIDEETWEIQTVKLEF